MRGKHARSLVAAVLAATGGCSFIGVRRPPPPPVPPNVPIECTQSRAAPVLDTVGAVATPLVGLGAWGLCTYLSAMQSWSSNPTRLNCGTVLWGTILSTAVYTGSAVYGYHYTGDCRRLIGESRVSMPQPRPGG